MPQEPKEYIREMWKGYANLPGAERVPDHFREMARFSFFWGAFGLFMLLFNTPAESPEKRREMLDDLEKEYMKFIAESAMEFAQGEGDGKSTNPI